MALLDDIGEATQDGDGDEVAKLVQRALGEGIGAQRIFQELLDGFGMMNERFNNDDAFLPEVRASADAMNGGVDILRPILDEDGYESLGKACLGTVEGDLHDIGKNTIRAIVECKGIEVRDLGVDVPASRFVEHVKEDPDCHLVMASALLTTTMPKLQEVVRAFEDAGLRDDVIIMVGGAPVTQEYADEIGADAYTPDGGACGNKAVELLADWKESHPWFR